MITACSYITQRLPVRTLVRVHLPVPPPSVFPEDVTFIGREVAICGLYFYLEVSPLPLALLADGGCCLAGCWLAGYWLLALRLARARKLERWKESCKRTASTIVRSSRARGVITDIAFHNKKNPDLKLDEAQILVPGWLLTAGRGSPVWFEQPML